MKTKVETYYVCDAYMPYIINGDATGLDSNEEQLQVDRFLEHVSNDVPKGYEFKHFNRKEGESEFTVDEVSGLLANCGVLEVVFFEKPKVYTVYMDIDSVYDQKTKQVAGKRLRFDIGGKPYWFFVHKAVDDKSYDAYTVTELKTGMRVCRIAPHVVAKHKEIKQAAKEALRMLVAEHGEARVVEVIDNGINKLPHLN